MICEICVIEDAEEKAQEKDILFCRILIPGYSFVRNTCGY